MDQEHAATVANWIANIASASAVVMTLLGVLPAIAALVAGAWYGIQIYESDTVTRWRRHRHHRKIARLRAKLLMLQAETEQLTSTHDELSSARSGHEA